MDREAFDKRVNRHYEKAQEYVECLAGARTTFHSTAQAYEEAIQALIKVGALGVSQSGNIIAGWYDFDGQDPKQFSVMSARGVGLAGGAASIAAALGAPVAAWTLVGAFGTASTGAAIGGLSGAAATSATAAWFGGGSLAVGGLGMAAAPFVLTGIGAVAGLAVLGAAVTITRGVNRNRQEKIDDAVRKMDVAEERMEANQKWVSKHQDEAARINEKLIKTTAILEYLHGQGNSSLSSNTGKSCHNNSNSCDCVTNIGEALREGEDLVQEMEEGLPYDIIYLGRPSAVTSIKSIHAEPNSLHIVWEDPDDGESEISGYGVEYNRDGFLRDGKSEKKFTDEPESTLEGLSIKSEYEFTITARNPIGWGEESEEFKAQTTG